MEKCEIERKYIIKMPDLSIIKMKEGYTESEILQIYLKSEAETHRIRRRCYEGRTEYTETKKVRIDKLSCTEKEREIDSFEFDALSEMKDTDRREIIKKRCTFNYLGKTFEIDVYPQWKNTAIMECELKSREEKINMPPFIFVICEVTGNAAYSNAAMAKSFPCEIV
jgi:CYTH domain-containing protein